MNSDLLKKLYSQLKQFGLNSKEWVIQPISQDQYLIYNHKDPSFKFMGLTGHQGWAQIWVD